MNQFRLFAFRILFILLFLYICSNQLFLNQVSINYYHLDSILPSLLFHFRYPPPLLSFFSFISPNGFLQPFQIPYMFSSPSRLFPIVLLTINHDRQAFKVSKLCRSVTTFFDLSNFLDINLHSTTNLILAKTLL